MEFIIRNAVPEDMIHVYGMIKELAEFEQMPDGPKIDDKQLIEDGFKSPNPAFMCVVAESSSDQKIVGYAIYYYTYSTWEGRVMFLEDLYVQPEYRKQNIGLNLLKAVAKETVKINGTRLNLQVLTWNPAMIFYEKYGGTNLTKSEDWSCVRFNKEALLKLAESAD